MSRKMPLRCAALTLPFVLLAPICSAQTTKGSVLEASQQNLALTWEQANATLPSALTGQAVWQGELRRMPAVSAAARSPLVIFMHGSSGVAGFIREYQGWLASELGLPSIAPNSMAIPDRLIYKSPIDKPTYERIHALRLAELKFAFDRASMLPWVDPARIIIAGTSEGAVSIARFGDTRPFVRVLYAWSCEANYFVESARTAIPSATPVLAMIAAKDPYFSPENPWNRGYPVTGTCTKALKDHASATVVTLATNKHTIINFVEARDILKSFIQRQLSAGPAK